MKSSDLQPPVPTPASTESLSRAESTVLKPIHILVLEDMEELAQLLAENLRLRGFQVEIAKDGATALRLMQGQIFDIALVDIDLPDMSGFDVVRRSHEAGLLKDTRILFCTGGYIEERALQAAAQFPGSLFMSKPFTLKKLFASITDELLAAEPPCR